MKFRWLYILPAGLAGALMAIQGGLNSFLSKIIGLTQATFSVHFLAAITVFLFLIPNLFRGSFIPNIGKVPWHLWLAGPIGVAITYGVAVSFPRLGAGRATTAIVSFQLLTAYIIDHLGWLDLHPRPLQTTHLIGILLMGIGVHLLWRH